MSDVTSQQIMATEQCATLMKKLADADHALDLLLIAFARTEEQFGGGRSVDWDDIGAAVEAAKAARPARYRFWMEALERDMTPNLHKLHVLRDYSDAWRRDAGAHHRAVCYINQFATSEGWIICDSDERGYEIQADSDSPVFVRAGYAYDSEALEHVKARAIDGSALHEVALLLSTESRVGEAA